MKERKSIWHYVKTDGMPTDSNMKEVLFQDNYGDYWLGMRTGNCVEVVEDIWYKEQIVKWCYWKEALEIIGD